MNTTAPTPLEIPEILRATPSILSTLVECFSLEVLHWRPSADRWSAAMVLTHLAESEIVCFRTRLKRVIEEDNPLLAPYDQWSYFRKCDEFSVQSALDTLRTEREITLAFLSSLSAEVMTRTCQHHTLGNLTFENLLNEFAFHDMGHLRQIFELCRAYAFYPRMGLWRTYYQIAP